MVSRVAHISRGWSGNNDEIACVGILVQELSKKVEVQRKSGRVMK